MDLERLFNVLFEWLLMTISYFIGCFDGSLKCYLKGQVLKFSSNYFSPFWDFI
jgi:hypothetical protein